jgi:MarR family transcriptional regulator, organic hydroperoxide resistance regulator
MADEAENPGRKMHRLPVILRPEELALRTWVQFARTFTRIARRLDHSLETYGLSVPQFDILATLGFEEGITQQELAQRLLVTKGNICGMIDRMEASGWVQRRPDREDRRANRLFLTAQGRQLLDEAFPDQQRILNRMLGALGEGELQTLYQFLGRLEDWVEG